MSQGKARAVFWARMAGYTAASVIAPVTTFAIKFGLFTKNEPVVDALGNVIEPKGIALNGWGIICCIIIGKFLVQIFKEIAAANHGYSMTKQCYEGAVKLIPLVMLYGICFFLNGVIAQIMFCLATLLVCQAAAIPLNPLPKWRYEKTGEEDYRDLLSSLTDIVKNLNKKEDE